MKELQFCGANPPEQDTLIIASPLKTQDEQIFTIPVMFTVLYFLDSDNAMISDEVLNTQLRILNEDFRAQNPDRTSIVPAYQGKYADCKIQFVLAPNGIRRVKTTTAAFPDFLSFFDATKGGIPAVTPKKICNIYFAPFEWAGGVSIFPTPNVVGQWFDASVVRFGSWASRPGSSGYRIATHEIGHWLYLYHTFQGLCTPPGDHCDDTPAISSSSSGCQLDRKACDNITIANVQNHMDYSDCRLMFTEQQKTRMRSTLMSVRSELVTGNPTGTKPVVTIVSPQPGQVFSAPAAYTAECTVTDDTGVAKVEFFRNGTLIWTFTNPPYRIGMSGVQTGTYINKFIATDLSGEKGEAEVSITVGGGVPNQGPVASFTVSTSNLSCTLDASASSDPDGTITEYKWLLSDGTNKLGKIVTHTFSAAGTYQATLTVKDNLGAVNSITKPIIVTSTPPPPTNKIGEILKNSDNTITLKLD